MKPLQYAFGVCMLCASAMAPPASSPPSTPHVNLAGDWVGVLEYRDIRLGSHVFLPTWLTVAPEDSGSSLALECTWDDGPENIVRARSILQLGRASVTIINDESTDTYTIRGLDEFRRLNRGLLTLDGKGTEHGTPADFRITVTVQRNLYTFYKEVRREGSSSGFKFREAYTFSRSRPASL